MERPDKLCVLCLMCAGFVDRVLKPKFSNIDPVFGTSEALQNYLKMELFYDFVKFFGKILGALSPLF